jgi:hypothetical protein
MKLAQFLNDAEKQYNEDCGLYGCTWQGPGYHSLVPPGTWAHQTRGNLDMAVFLLRSDCPEHHARAHRITDIILGHQDTSPYSHTYGIWPWLVEESLKEMSPPDFNWADFCGSSIAVMLAESADRIPTELQDRMRAALGHAGWSIFRRNVQPGYTNIAIMGACVTCATGEMLNEPRLLRYGRDRLAAFLDHTDYHGGLNEYNSPTYTFVALHECERILQLVTSPEVREMTERLRRFVWNALAERFHPATGQLVGPHSRAYGDTLATGTLNELAVSTGQPIVGADGAALAPSVVTHLPCPEDLCARFAALPAETEVRTRFIRREPDANSTVGTSWLADEACLGSVNADCLWIQRRPLIGYVKTADGTAVLKAEFLRDGKPCSSAEVHNHQAGPRVLSAFQLVTNKGDHHIHLDRPKDGTFQAADWRIRYRAIGTSCTVEQPSANEFLFTIGDWQARLLTLPILFDGHACSWSCGSDAEGCWVDAVLYMGESKGWPVAKLGETTAAAALELVAAGTPSSGTQPTGNRDGSTFRYAWGELAVDMPALPFAGV